MKEDRTMMEKETKEERFKRIAEKRVQNIIHAIRNLSGLSNKKVYEWETEQLEKIWKAIDKEVENCKDSFKNPESKIFKF
jgi:predicted transcriptional regulator